MLQMLARNSNSDKITTKYKKMRADCVIIYKLNKLIMTAIIKQSIILPPKCLIHIRILLKNDSSYFMICINY